MTVERSEMSIWPRLSTRSMLFLGAGLASLWLLRSSLGDVYSEIAELGSVDSRWLAAIVAAEAVTFVAAWELNRLALRTDRWFDVAVAQLAGNAANNVVPGGGPVGAAVQLRVLSEAGFDLTTAATSLAALSIVGAVGLLCLPVIALPFALVEGDRALEPALWVGAGLLVALVGAAATLLARDRPLFLLASAVQWAQNRLRPWPRRLIGLPDRVLVERDLIRSEFRRRPFAVGLAAVGKPGGDCLALYLCLVAVGAHPNPVAVLAAFAAANVAGMVPFTPGGLGFVEAGITASLVATGINTEHAVIAAALYRVASTWLPAVAGLVAYGIFRYRRRDVTESSPSRLSLLRRLVVPLVTVVALVLVSPVLFRVYRRLPEVVTLAPGWLAAIAAMIALHFVAAWALYRVVLRTSGWFDIAASQLASNAASHVAPAGSAVGAGMQLRMLIVAGHPASRAATALGATTALGTVAGYVVLPLIVLTASVFGSTVEPRLIGAMWFSVAVLASVLVAVIVLAVQDAPWEWVARVVTAIRLRLGQPVDVNELAERLIQERNLMRSALRQRAGLVVFLVFAQPLADYAALYLALRAVGAHVSATAVLAAFIVSNVAGLIPFTPGGLGFVEAGLTGVLTVAGAARPEARLAVVTYRLVATWIPCLAGAAALASFHRRHRNAGLRTYRLRGGRDRG